MTALLRDAVAVALVAALVFLSMRRWVGDHYVVPSDSMQPTLFGAASGGDVVYVDKLASAASLRRYDLAVFRSSAEGADLVKRVVAFGDDPEACCLELRDGDLWLGPDAQRLQRAVKDPLACRDLRIPWLQWPQQRPEREPLDGLLASPHGTAPDQLSLPRFDSADAARRACGEDVRRAQANAEAERGDRSGGGWLATLQPVDATYLDVHGVRGTAGAGLLVDDVGADFEFAGAGVDSVLCGLDLRPDSWVFHWRLGNGEGNGDGGSVELWRNGETVATHALPATVAGARMAAIRVEYGYLDGRFFFAVDGRPDSLWLQPRRLEWVVADPGPMSWSLAKTRLYLGVTGVAAAPLSKLQVFHDVHWFRPHVEIGVDPARFSPVRHLQPGQVYLLGDNSADSRDSRMFGAVALATFVGRPRLVMGPWPRFSVLLR